MPTNTANAKPETITPGANEVAMVLPKDVADALHQHLVSESPLADEHKDSARERVLGALETESHEKKESHATSSGDCIVLLSPNAARDLQNVLTTGGSLDTGVKNDLARRIASSMALHGEAPTPITHPDAASVVA